MSERFAGLAATTKRYLRTALDWDLGIGVAVGVAAGALACESAVREQGVTFALASAAAGVAITSVALGTLSVITTFVDGPYRRVLEDAGGTREAMAPYLVVSAAAGAASVCGLLTAIGWALFCPIAQIITIGLTVGLVGWSVAGTVALVELTIFHAESRATLIGELERGQKQGPVTGPKTRK